MQGQIFQEESAILFIYFAVNTGILGE